MDASREPRSRPARRAIWPLFALGLTLARRGILPALSIAICIFTTLALSILAISLAVRSASSPVHNVPIVASSALAWGGGFLLAFASAAHALRRDRTEGIRDLLVARTTSLRGYLLARVGGLALLIAILVGGGTLFTGLVGVAASARLSSVAKILQSTGAGVAFAVAFALVVSPVAFAALGARSRLGGYMFLLVVVVFPEMVVAMMGSAIPEGVTDVLSIPSALSALRTALSPGTADAARALRAALALALFVFIAVFLVRRDAVLLERGEADG
ncbi:MAG: hypothetical protein KF819_05045 [Labilithrix sp.]|nr:hypothetical protein [Labilithrix sp.]